MKYLVTIDRDEDGIWIVECPAIPGCVSREAQERKLWKISKKRSSCVWKFELKWACH